MIVIALTFGNQSDWSRNVRSAGGGTIRIDGENFNVTQPQVMSRQEAKPLVQAAFSPINRAGFRSARSTCGRAISHFWPDSSCARDRPTAPTRTPIRPAAVSMVKSSVVKPSVTADRSGT